MSISDQSINGGTTVFVGSFVDHCFFAHNSEDDVSSIICGCISIDHASLVIVTFEFEGTQTDWILSNEGYIVLGPYVILNVLLSTGGNKSPWQFGCSKNTGPGFLFWLIIFEMTWEQFIYFILICPSIFSNSKFFSYTLQLFRRIFPCAR